MRASLPPSEAPQWSCARCLRDTDGMDVLRCLDCGCGYHWQCFALPVGLFPSRLAPGTAESMRRGDTRRDDFVCPSCNFGAVMRRPPVRGQLLDAYLILCDAQVTVDEYHYDAASTSANCWYTLRKMGRWKRIMGVPVMVARDHDTLQRLPRDHRQLSWYLVDQTSAAVGSKWQTAKKHRSAVYNYYERLAVSDDDIPTSTVRFTHRMNGLRQRLGDDPKQNKVFSDVLIEDMVALLQADYVRARGERRVHLARVNLAFHGYLQAGMRANEWFTQRLGPMVDSFCFGADAVRRRVLPHFKLSASAQTKENRFSTTEVWCCHHTKHAPLRTGAWAEILVAELTRLRDDHADQLVFRYANGDAWTMGRFWGSEIEPRLHQLLAENLGGLRDAGEIDDFGSNSFRRTWNTLAGSDPDPVSSDLRDRQGRWRSQLQPSMAMSSLYFDPKPNELLKATYLL